MKHMIGIIKSPCNASVYHFYLQRTFYKLFKLAKPLVKWHCNYSANYTNFLNILTFSYPMTTVALSKPLKAGSRLCSGLGQRSEHAFIINKQTSSRFHIKSFPLLPFHHSHCHSPSPSCNCLELHSVSVFLFTLFVCPMNRAIAFAFNNHLCNLLFDSTQLASPRLSKLFAQLLL